MSLQDRGKKKWIAILVVIFVILAIIVFFKNNAITKYGADRELLKTLTYAEVKDGEDNIENTEENVKFDAFFMRDLDEDGIQEKLRGTCKQIGKEDTLYISLDVLEGELRDAQIVVNENEQTNGESNSENESSVGNVYLQGAILQDDVIKENIIETNVQTIALNSISNKSKTITAKVHSGDYVYESRKMDALKNDINAYSKINTITLKGIYVSPEGEEMQISKKVDFTVDWYGEIESDIPQYAYGKIDNKNQVKDITTAIDEHNKKFIVDFDVYVQEIKNELLLQDLTLKLAVPKLNGTIPNSVEVVSPNTDYEYYEDTKELNIYRGTYNGKLEDGVYNGNRVNKFKIKMIYPLENIDVKNIDFLQVDMPVEVCYSGYNNNDSYFENPTYSERKIETISLRYASKTEYNTEVKVNIGKRELNENIVSKEKIQNLYNNIPNKDEIDSYLVGWNVESDSKIEKYIIKQNENGTNVADKFIKSDGTSISMENISQNVGIYFYNASNFLGEDGQIKVYDDETNELVARFTQDNLNSCTSENPYMYEVPAKYVRIEATNVNANTSMIVYNIKMIDDEYIINNYTEEEFNNLKYIETSVSGYLGEELINTDIDRAIYKETELVDEYNGDINLKVVKSKIDSENKISNIKFKLSGLNYEDGKVLVTNTSGELEFKGLTYNKEYILEEMGSNTYIKPEKIRFIITDNKKINILEGSVKSSEIITENDVSVAILNIEGTENSSYNLEISKIIRPEKTGLANVKYRLYCEKKCVGEYVTDENGIIHIENIYEYDVNQHTSNQYILKEISTPEGYTKSSNDIKFRIENRPDGLKMVITEGNVVRQSIEDGTIKVEISAKKATIPSFKLTNKDGETGEFLIGTKFAIYKINGENDEVALDTNYDIVGTKEVIDGKEYYILTTNESGEISADLREGLYKAIEIETVDNKYELSNNVYYFGVGVSEWKEHERVSLKEISDNVIKTSDGYISYGLEAKETDTDVIILKYSKDGQIIWKNTIEGSGNENIYNLESTNDGGVITYVISTSEEVRVGNEIHHNPISGYEFGILIKYDKDGIAEWSKVLGYRGNTLKGGLLKTNDNGYIKYGNLNKPRMTIESVTIKNMSTAYGYGDSAENEDLDDDAESGSDIVIVKYSSTGKIEWINNIAGRKVEALESIVVQPDGGYLAYGATFSGSTVLKTEDTVTEGITQNQVLIKSEDPNDVVTSKGVVLKYNSEGKLEKFMCINPQENYEISRGYAKILKAIETLDGGVLACGEFSGIFEYGENSVETSSNNSDGILIKFSNDCEVEWVKTLKGNNLESIKDIIEVIKGEYIIAGTYNGPNATFDGYDFNNTLVEEEIEAPDGNEVITYYSQNSMTARIDSNGNVLSAQPISAYKSAETSTILKTNDNGYIITGTSNNDNIIIDDYYVLNNIPGFSIDDTGVSRPIYDQNSFMLKFDSSDRFECGKFVLANELKSFKNKENIESLIYLKDKEMVEERVTNSSNFEVLNSIKELKLSTRVENNEGGNISGGDRDCYEIIRYGEASTKEIKVVPNEGYEIGQILINGKSCNYILNSDGSANIETISNITENKEIVVNFILSSQKLTINVKDNNGNSIENAKFSIKNINNGKEKTFVTNSSGIGVTDADFGTYEIRSIDIPYGFENNYFCEYIVEEGSSNLNIVLQKLDKVTVHHYLKNRNGVYTTEKIAEDDVYLGKTGENYNVEPKLDLEKYELEKDSNNKYIIPDLAVGNYFGSKEVIYYYEERQAILLVHHYNVGTNNKTYLGDYSEAEDKEYRGYIGEEYTVSDIPNYDANNPENTLAEGYSLVDIAGNEQGIYERNETIVYYYYDIETFEITTKVNEHIEITDDGEEITARGGTISGEGEKPYETVAYGGETIRDYIVTPDLGYEIVSVKVNGQDMEFSTNSDGVATLGCIENIKEDKEIEVFFERVKGYVLVHYIDEETDKQIIPDEVISGYIGYKYNLEISEEIPVYYENTRTEGQISGVFSKEQQEATFYFRLKNYDYILEYYYDEEIDEERTETKSAKYGTEIILEDLTANIERNIKPGFKFKDTINLPLVITELAEYNIIKIFYTSDGVIDENMSTYRVEYYYDNIIDNDKTDRLSAHIGDIIDTYVDKPIDGYVLVSTVGLGLVVDKDPNKNVIKIYYENLGTTENLANYVLEYYYDGIQDKVRTQTIKTIIGTEITKDFLATKIEENLIEGYRLYSLKNVPLIVSKDEDENIIKIYYVKKETSGEGGEGEEGDKTPDSNYIIQYYYDDVINKSLTETIVSKVGKVITREAISGNVAENKIKGYKLHSIINIPLTVSEDEDKNIIKIKYVKRDEGEPDEEDDNNPNKSEYVVKYYYDDEIDNTKTETIVAFIGDVITSYTDNCIEGYRLKETIGIPLTVVKDKTKNVIEVYYIKDDGTIIDPENQTGYKIEYYYDNVLEKRFTNRVIANEGEVITEETIKNKIEKYTLEGYKFFTTNLPITVDGQIDKNVVKVFYVSESLGEVTGYKIEYYYNNKLNTSLTEAIVAEKGTKITQEMLEDKITQNTLEGYSYFTTNLPIEVGDNIEENIVKIYYIRGYILEFYYDGIIDTAKTEKVQANIGNVIKLEDIEEKINNNIITGYEFSRVETLPKEIIGNIENNVIKIYYEKAKFEYRIEYYYNGQIDDEKTEKHEATYKDEITEEMIYSRIESNKKEGYIFNTVGYLPLQITEKPENNVIRVYYLKEIETGYKVEYYYNGTIDKTKTELIEAEVGDIITTYTDKNIEGYKFLAVENIPLTVSENLENNIIKVCYIKEITEGYKLEFYYDEKLDNTKTEMVEAEIGSTITEDLIKEKINKNIKEDYKFIKTENVPLTVEENLENNVIKIYYGRQKVNYKVEYYYDNLKDETKTETIEARYKDKITTYTDKNIVGYKLQKTENLPLVLSEQEENNIIKIYYVKDEFDYTIEYYYNGVLDENKTETLRALYQTQITKDMIQTRIDFNNVQGYKFYGMSNLPLITENIEKNKIQIYYLKDVEIGYMLEYYYNGVIDMSKTEVVEANIGDVINSYPDKKVDGYKLLTVLNMPLTVSEKLEDNVIKVCYIKDVFGYTVEYYYNGKIDDTKTERVAAVVGEEITKDNLNENIERNTIIGYGYENAENLPLTVKENLEDNTIKVNYGLLDFYYEVQYYYDGILDNNKTVISLAKYGDIITSYQDKNITGYTLDKEVGLPLEITENQSNNIIKVYYEKAEFEYKVEYYFDGVLDEDLTIISKELYKEEIREVPNKVKEGYKVEKTENIPLTISENIENNTIKVYYVENICEIIVRYVDKNTGIDLQEPIKQQDRVGKLFDISNLKKKFDMYLLLEEPETTGVYTEETQTLIYYYAIKSNVIVKYLEKDDTPDDYTDNPVLTYIDNGEEKTYEYEIEGFEGASYTTEAKEIPEYSLVETTNNTSGTMSDVTTTVIYYYVKNASIKIQHIDEKTDGILKEEVIKGKVGDIVETSPEEFEGYVLVREPENKDVIMKKDEVVIVKYYYKEISDGVIEKHIDNNSEKLLYSEHHEGSVGDTYKIDAREFENYDLLEDKLPENAEGVMTRETITVNYYYVKKAKVVVQYIDKFTNEIMEDAEIGGHEGDEYSTEPKEFEGYELVEEPENKTGKMTPDTIYVKYYYSQKSEGVIEKHIDVKTNDILEETEHKGYVGDNYKIEPKEFEGYDIVESKLPQNAEGTMTVDKIEVNYYYIKKSKVLVEYIDKARDKIIDKEEILGHEGESYQTKAKEIKNYMLIEEPENNNGVMLRDEVVTVRYYYKNIAGKVIVQYIDVKTDKLLEKEKVYIGSEGDIYKTKPKEFEGYDIVKEHLPENSEGTMTSEEIVVKYYYIRKAVVKVKYIDIDTKNNLNEDTIIEGHEDQKYQTKAKDIKGYKLVNEKLPQNSEGYMTVEPIIVAYYYKLEKQDNPVSPDSPDLPNNTNKPDKPNDSNNDINNNGGNNINNSFNTGNNSSNNPNIANNNNTKNSNNEVQNKENVPYTGDIISIVTIAIVILVIVLNIIQKVVSKIHKRNNKFIK